MKPGAVRAALAAIALAAPLLTLVPPWYGYHVASPPERVFLGFRHMAVDHYLYASFLRQARDTGSPFMQNRFTSEPQDARYVPLFYWLLGVTVRLTGAPIVLLWEASRIAGGVLYVLLFWRLAGVWVSAPGRRVVGTAIFAFGGGVDWVVALVRLVGLPVGALGLPYEYFWNWSAFGTLVVAHWVWGSLLILLVWSRLLGGGPARRVVVAALLPVVWFVHPYSGFVAYGTLALVPLVPLVVAAARLEPPPWARIRASLGLALPGLASFGLVAAYALWARGDDVFRMNSAITYSWPSHFTVGWYPLTYGLLLPLAWFGLRVTAREATLGAELLLAWLAAAFVLSVNPVYQGVKFQYQLYPPLAILAARGLFHLLDVSPAARRALGSGAAVAALALVLGLDAPLSVVKDLPATKGTDELYLSAAELQAMRWLDAQPPGVVLCGYKCGSLVPWLAGKTAHFGHWGMTLHIQDKGRQVAWFFSPQAPLPVKRDVLRASRARYVYAGPAEAAAGPVDPALPLREVYRKDGVTIYEVTGPG